MKRVTILILIDGFLQSIMAQFANEGKEGHNPYFNRGFLQLKPKKTEKRQMKSQSLF